MATYAELREKYVNGQGKEQQTKKREAPDNAQIVAGARQYLAEHQAENAGKWAAWQEAATARDNASAAARAAEEAQKKYDEYLLTDEAQSYVRQNQAAKGAQMLQGAGISTPYASGMQQQAAPQKDQKAEALKAERDRLKNMMNAENDRYVMESDLAELATWTEEDRSNLDKYVGFRQTGITSGGYAVPAKEAYNNLVAKYGKEKVDQLAYTWQRDKNAKDTKALAERSAAAVKGNTGKAIGHSAATIPANLLGSVAGSYGVALDWATRDNRYSTLDPNNIGTMASVYSGAVRGQVAEDISGDEYDENGALIKDGGVIRQGLSIGYQGAMSAADSIARAAAGGGGFGTLALAATGSFSQTVSEASKQGATPQQAIILGIGNAALEAATEKVPLDNMLKAAKGGIKGAKAIAKEALRQAAIEATEEEISLFGSLLLEAAVLQEKSAYQQSIAESIANGMSYEEAKEQADKAVWAEALNTAMVSAVAGGFSGGGSAIAGNVFNGSAEAAQKPVEAATQQKETQTQEQPDVAHAVVQELTQAQETEAQANAAQMPKERQAAQDVADMLMGKEKPAQPAQATDNSTGSKSIKLYRGYNQSDDPTRKNLTSKQSVYNILGREDPNEITNLLPLAYYTENEEDARSYADMDVRTMDEYRKNGIYEYRDRVMRGKDVEGLSEKEYADRAAKRSFLMLHGREPNAGGRVERYDYTPGKVLDLTELGETTSVDAAYKVLADKFGIEPSKLDDILTLGNNFKDDFPVFALLRNTPRDNLGTKIVDLAKKGGHDSIRYSEDGNIHYAIVTDRQGWDKKLTKDMDASNIQQQSTEDVQGIKGTGAAEQNFSGKAQYQDLLYEGNVQPDREGDVRPMEVPNTDLQGNPVSATAANVYGSQYTTDDLASAEESAIAKGELSYIKIANDQAAERASKTIESAGGWREAYMQWHDEVRDGKTSAEMAARGAMLLNHAAEVYEQTKATGDDVATKEAKQEWLNILMDVQSLGTNTAQGLQALRMIRELSPPDKLDFAVASVKRMVADMKLQEDITIDEGLLNEYRMAETDEQRDEIMGRIQQNVADQIPSTFLDKWTALRYMNMLGNLKTNVRNFAGNVGSMIAYRIKDQFAAGMESIASVFDKNYQRTKSHTVSKELLNFAKNDFNAIKSAVNGGGKYNERMTADAEFQQGVMDKRTVFKSNNAVLNAAMKPLEAYRRGTNWMMNNEYFGDEAFGRAAYARAMAGFLKANGVNDSNIENVNKDLLDRARTYAIKEAQEATFKDNTALANIVSKVQKSTGVVGQAIMPFTKTPANVLVRAVEFSPVGILDTAAKTAKMELSKTNLTNKTGLVGDVARSGEKITGADIVNSLAKNLTGTALFGLGALLWDQGLLSAGPSDDEEEATLDNLTGKQPYSLQFTGLDGVQHSYTMDWLSPVAMPMFMGAEFWKALQETNGTMTFADYEQLFTSIADPMIQMSMLQGLNDTLESIKWSDNNLGQFFLNAACSYLTQGITNTLIGQLERTTEKNRTTTYVDENSNIPKKMQQLLGKTSQKIPGWDFQQMEYRNKFGATEENEGGLLYNVASPGYISTEDNDAVTQELYRLNESTTEKITPPDIPKKVSYTNQNGEKLDDYQLTEEQYQKMAQTQGQTAKKILDQMVTSSDYKKLTDDQKAYAIKAAYEYAQEQGKKAALPGYHSKAAEWISKTKESDIQAFVTRGATQALNSAISSAVSNLGDGLPVTEATKADMEETYKAFANMSAKTKEQILDEASAATVKYLTARQNGATAKNYLDVVQNVKALGEKPKDAQTYNAVVNTPGMTDAVKDALVKAYMTDYDPDAKSPDKTELKYDYIRQKMEMTPQEYAQVYSIYDDIYGKKLEEVKKLGYKDKKSAYLDKWVKMGFSSAQANELYNLLVNTSENTRIDVVSWYKNQ